MNSKSLAILTVATNKYIHFWKAMVESADKALAASNTQVIAHVLTDQIQEAERIADGLQNIRIVTHDIPSYGWPEAALFKFRLINQIADEIYEDLVMHLDADMLVLQDFIRELPDNFKNGIGLVLHPGYFRPKGIRKLKFYLFNLNYLRQDIRGMLTLGNLGDWETSKHSKTYVRRMGRNKYVCGATWFGDRGSFFNMVEELTLLEKIDTENCVIPKWHDESILNFWCSRNDVTLLSPSFCFEPSYPQLANLPEFIRAVDKNV